MKTRVKDLSDFEEYLRVDLRAIVRRDFACELEYDFAFGSSPTKPLCSALWLTVYEELENET